MSTESAIPGRGDPEPAKSPTGLQVLGAAIQDPAVRRDALIALGMTLIALMVIAAAFAGWLTLLTGTLIAKIVTGALAKTALGGGTALLVRRRRRSSATRPGAGDALATCLVCGRPRSHRCRCGR